MNDADSFGAAVQICVWASGTWAVDLGTPLPEAASAILDAHAAHSPDAAYLVDDVRDVLSLWAEGDYEAMAEVIARWETPAQGVGAIGALTGVAAGLLVRRATELNMSPEDLLREVASRIAGG